MIIILSLMEIEIPHIREIGNAITIIGIALIIIGKYFIKD